MARKAPSAVAQPWAGGPGDDLVVAAGGGEGDEERQDAT
jgi:hypothetical protein